MTQGPPLEPQAAATEPATETIESHATPTPTWPVPSGLSPRLRWLIAGGAVVAAVAIVGIALAVLGARPVPPGLTYIPRDSDIVIELRPDLPGDQQQRVGNLLAHLPGFADQSTLAQKLDESLARITTAVSSGAVDYATQVKPWLAGPVFAAGDSRLTPDAGPSFVIVFTTDGTVTCEPFTETSTATETYRGLEIHTTANGGATACVLDGRQAVVGAIDTVKAALDAHADHTAIDGTAAYRTARDKLHGDQLATVYVAYRQALEDMSAAMPGGLQTFGLPAGALAAALPEWVIAGLRGEDNAFVADIVMAPFDLDASALLGLAAPGASPLALPTLLTPPPPHASTIASIVPPNTAALFEVHGAGVAAQNLLVSLRAMPGLGGSEAPFDQLDAALGALGGAGSLIGWVGDAGVVVLTDGVTADTGVILVAPDDAAATAKADQIRGWLALASQGLATTTETTVDGVKVTLVDFGDASTLLGQFGAASPGLSIPPGTKLVLSIAARGSNVIIGSGESFARQVIETAAGSSLADQASYKTAIGLGSAANTGQLYVAVAPFLAFAEGLIPAAERTQYESDVKPYVAHVDAILETVAPEGDGIRIRIVVTVK